MKKSVQRKWELYESVGQSALEGLLSSFGFDTVEGKQHLEGKITRWELDALIKRSSDGMFFIVECRRYPKRCLNQETVGGIAYKMRDVGASGAVIVTPKELQYGAKKIAAAENIFLVKVMAESTLDQFICEFHHMIAVGIRESATLSVQITGDYRLAL